MIGEGFEISKASLTRGRPGQADRRSGRGSHSVNKALPFVSRFKPPARIPAETGS
jgi:hypothetical protein